MAERVMFMPALLVSGLLAGCFSTNAEDAPAPKAREATIQASAPTRPLESSEPVLPEGPRAVEFSSRKTPEETPEPRPLPKPEPTPEVSEPTPTPTPPPGDATVVDPPHHEAALEICDRAIKKAMVGSYEGEGDGLIVARATPKSIYDVPNENIAYRTRTSTRANIWRLEYNIHTGDCRHAYNYATVNFAELEQAPRHPGEWSIRRGDEDGYEYAERATLEIDGVRVVVHQDTGLEEEGSFKHAARECAEALSAAREGDAPGHK